jgi:hypothetical protein
VLYAMVKACDDYFAVSDSLSGHIAKSAP